MTCKHGHDHSAQNVWIPMQRDGRKFHCPSAPHAKTYPEDPSKWKLGTLADAVDDRIPKCELCFGARRLDARISN